MQTIDYSLIISAERDYAFDKAKNPKKRGNLRAHSIVSVSLAESRVEFGRQFASLNLILKHNRI